MGPLTTTPQLRRPSGPAQVPSRIRSLYSHGYIADGRHASLCWLSHIFYAFDVAHIASSSACLIQWLSVYLSIRWMRWGGHGSLKKIMRKRAGNRRIWSWNLYEVPILWRTSGNPVANVLQLIALAQQWGWYAIYVIYLMCHTRIHRSLLWERDRCRWCLTNMRW